MSKNNFVYSVQLLQKLTLSQSLKKISLTFAAPCCKIFINNQKL